MSSSYNVNHDFKSLYPSIEFSYGKTLSKLESVSDIIVYMKKHFDFLDMSDEQLVVVGKKLVDRYNQLKKDGYPQNKPVSREKLSHNLNLHMGLVNPEGNPDCLHEWRYNDETMGGCGSGWDRICDACGKTEVD